MKLFVHIPKCGGMTVRRNLSDRILVANAGNHISAAYTAAVARRMIIANEHHGFEHARLRDWSRDLRAAYPAFALVRNPWARTVSRYTFACVTRDRSGQQSFREFLEERHLYGGMAYYWHRGIRGWYPQRDYVVDENDRLGVDVLRLESDDLQRYFGLDSATERRGVSNTKGADYRDFYDDECREIVADWYAEDIDFFGFSFDGPATSNLWTPES